MSRTIRLLLPAVLAAALAAASCGPTAPTKRSVKTGTFYGSAVPEAVRKSVYVLNYSISTPDSFGYVKQELKRTLRELSPEYEFHIIFCSSGPAVAMPPGRLVPRTDSNKQAADKFIDAAKPQGKTDPSDALRKAFALKPDTIYFLTDGPVAPAIAKTIRDLNPDKKVCLHTIAFLCRDGEELLRTIASENGGGYRFVSEADLAELSKETEPPAPAKPEEGAATPQQ